MVTAIDDFTHQVSDDLNFNESMYFEFHDPVSRLGGFLRLANRPNEGRGERTVCIYLPNGSVAFGFARPPVTTNDAMSAGGLTVEVVAPLDEVIVRFTGDVSVIADPRILHDPKAAFSSSPVDSARVVLQYNAIAPAHEQTFESDGQSFAPNHYEQLGAVRGLVEIGEHCYRIIGHGLRDHSWGPRSWQAPWFYRWLHGCTDQFGFMTAYFGSPDGSSRRGGFIFADGGMHACDDVAIITERDDDGFQRSIHVSITAGQRHWQLHGEALTSVPLRHRGTDDATSTRIIESAIRWELDDGRELHGMAEYLDQIRDGQPVGKHV